MEKIIYSPSKAKAAAPGKKTYSLPPLPYPLDALEPHISSETLEYHYGKHHKGYVDTLNKIIVGSGFEGLALDELIKRTDGPLFANAAQTWNHTFFWNCLTPEPRPLRRGELRHALELNFGSLEDFKNEFSTHAKDLFGSGWVWLVKDPSGQLLIKSEANAGNPLGYAQAPLLLIIT